MPSLVPMMCSSVRSMTPNQIPSFILGSTLFSSVFATSSGRYSTDSQNCTICLLHGWPRMRSYAVLPSLPRLYLDINSPHHLTIHVCMGLFCSMAIFASVSTWLLSALNLSCVLRIVFSILPLLSDSPRAVDWNGLC